MKNALWLLVTLVLSFGTQLLAGAHDGYHCDTPLRFEDCEHVYFMVQYDLQDDAEAQADAIRPIRAAMLRFAHAECRAGQSEFCHKEVTYTIGDPDRTDDEKIRQSRDVFAVMERFCEAGEAHMCQRRATMSALSAVTLLTEAVDERAKAGGPSWRSLFGHAQRWYDIGEETYDRELKTSRAACNAGNAKSCLRAAFIIFRHDTRRPPEDFPLADIFADACTSGHSDACEGLISLARGLAKDHPARFASFSARLVSTCERGVAPACRALGSYLKDDDARQPVHQKACAAGVGSSCLIAHVGDDLKAWRRSDRTDGALHARLAFHLEQACAFGDGLACYWRRTLPAAVPAD